MMLRTKYDITVEIDDKEFSITVTNLNKNQKETLDKSHGEKRKRWENNAKLEKKFIRLIERYDLFKQSNDIHKAIEMLDEIEQIEAKLSEESFSETLEALDELHHSRFLMMVSGPDKERLHAYIEETMVGFKTVMEYIDTDIAKAREGK